jgi:glycosyltransferase involved in cell wall biosynthesis
LKGRKLRILIYSDHFFPSIGGSENYAFDLASQLVNYGHVVGVITSQRNLEEDNFSFSIYRLKKTFSIYKINFGFFEIPAIIKKFRPDVIQINYQTGGENILIILLKILNIPFVITYHADHIRLIGKVIDEFQLLSTFRLAKVIMVQSERDDKKFRKKGIDSRKLKLIRFTGIDLERYKCSKTYSLNKENVKLVCIARLDDSHRYKGVYELIESIRSIKQEELGSKLSLRIIGDGNLKSVYEDFCRDANLNNITFLGDLSFNDLLGQICQSNFLILPSIDKDEGFGRVVLEALSCGIPVIVSKYAGIAELVTKHEAGIVFDPTEYLTLVKTINNIINEPSELKKLIKNGRKLIAEEELSLSSVTEKVIDVYYSSIK